MDLFAELNPQQQEAVSYTDGPLLILAGAGSGKTKVLTCKIAFLLSERLVVSSQVLAMTFSNKASEEIGRRVERAVPGSSKAIWMGTFHSIGARLLRNHADRLGYSRSFTILDSQDQLSVMKQVLRDANINEAALPVRMFQHAVDTWKNTGKSPNQVASDAKDRQSEMMRNCYERYQNRLIEHNCMDFGDLLLNPLLLFEQHPDVLQGYRLRFEAIFIDEYQDTNHAQFRLLHALAQGKRHVTVVGDDDQSIYGWRGADISNILDFPATFPATKIIKLECNYRSTKPILDAAALVVSRNRNRYPKELFTHKTVGAEVEVQRLPDDQAEAVFVARRIVEWRASLGLRYRDLAVFYRTNAQSRLFEEEFLRMGVPYRIVGGQKFFERAEIKDLLAYLRFLVNPADALSLQRIINVPARGIGKTTLERCQEEARNAGLPLFDYLRRCAEGTEKSAKSIRAFVSLCDKLKKILENEKPAAAVAALIEAIGYREYLLSEHGLEADSRIDNIQELASSVAVFFAANPTCQWMDYLEAVTLMADGDHQDTERDQVVLMTVHCSKGLEFEVVFMAGMEEGLFPHSRSKSEREFEEERRLCYVGMTRARERLVLSHCAIRRVFGQTRPAFPSVFIRDLKKSAFPGGGMFPSAPKKGFPLASTAQGRTPSPFGRPTAPAVFGQGPPAAAMQGQVPVEEASSRYVYDQDAADPEIGSPGARTSGFEIGSRVRHRIFGYGVIKDKEEGPPERYAIYFVGYGMKKLSANPAILEPAGEQTS